jgi:methylmalonyl-CoA mutase N-terminal domain/subunit
VINTIDPLGGSWFVEEMTQRMVDGAFEYFRRIDELGGMVEAIKRDFPQREIADASFRYQQEIDSKKRIVVGVNDYRLADEEEPELHRPDPAVARKQLGRLSATRARRDSNEVGRTLAALKQAASSEGENLMPYFLDAARARASEGEMVAALQEVFGSYTEQPVF